MRVRFTARTAASVQPVPGRRLELKDLILPGLSLRITSAGVKSWSVQYRNAHGRLRRLTLGTWPTMTLATARQQARAALRAVDGGADPADEKREARHGDTVADLARDYLSRHARVHKRSWREDARMLDAEVLPAWKHVKVRELTRRDVRALVERIADRGAPTAANRYLALVRKVLNHGLAHDWIDANVAMRLPAPGAEQSRDRVLTNDEIRTVWATCETERPAVCALMRLRFLIAARGGELARLRWVDVSDDGHWITIPTHISKNKQAHRVPLVAAARAILAGLPRIVGVDYVFPGRAGNRPLGDVKQAGSRIMRRALVELQRADPTVTPMRAHDIRRTVATRMAEAGVSQADIARVLGHAEGGPRATQVYNRYSGDVEKRRAVERWAGELARILEAK